MNRFKIVIGDDSGDGHSQKETFLVECNHTVQNIEKAYENSCKLTGLQMNTNTNFTGLDLHWSELSKRKMCNEYEDDTLSEFHKDVLKGFEIPEEILNFEGDPDAFLIFFLEFLKLSIPDLQCTVVSETVPSFKYQIGYGLFTEG